jgi:hypothetical protein
MSIVVEEEDLRNGLLLPLLLRRWKISEDTAWLFREYIPSPRALHNEFDHDNDAGMAPYGLQYDEFFLGVFILNVMTLSSTSTLIFFLLDKFLNS